MLWHAYIDESGDRGWKERPAATPVGQRAGSSRTFTMSAVLVPDGTQPAILRTWDAAAAQTGRQEVHWQNVKSTGARKHLISSIASDERIATISVVLCKWHLPNVSKVTDPGFFYHWTARLLVERLSWFGNATGDHVAMTFAQVKGHPPTLVRNYLRKLGGMPTYIEWPALKQPPAFSTPKVRRMLQLADTASGAVYAAFEPDDFGYTDQTYINILKPRIWRRGHRELWQDGMKVGPWPHDGCKAEHPWFEAFCK